MAKIFITLYLVVISSFGLFIVSLMGLETIGDYTISLIEERFTKGTFQLLDESIKDLDQQQTATLVTEYKKVFGTFFELMELSSLSVDKRFDKQQLDDLEQGKVVSVEESIAELNKDDTSSMVYHRSSVASLVWRVHLDTAVDISVNNVTVANIVTGGKFVDGMFFLLEAKLRKEPQDQWTYVINTLQPSYGLPLKIIAIDDELANALPDQDVVNTTQGSIQATFVKKITPSQALQIGPVKIPWFMRNIVYITLSALALSIATVLFLWVWPLWSNLIKIKNAAEEFGAGRYDTRIPYKKQSLIAKIAQSFNAMAERTQSSIRSHKELTTAVSHELRTPVARMRFALEMLADSDQQDDKERFIKDIGADIDELDLLLEELLTYARFDQGNQTLHRHDEKLIPWLNHCLEKLTPLTNNKTLKHHIEGIAANESVLIEPRLMARVLDNLVQNALRYARQTVTVTLGKEAGSYLLTVEDDGPGIPEKDREHIFDAFSRIDASRDRASGGFGLGLAIADKIVKAHQGSIMVKDSTQGGACFEVKFPANN